MTIDPNKIIDVTAGLTTKAITRKGVAVGRKDAIGVEINVEKTVFIDLNEQSIAGRIAADLTQIIRANLQSGRMPNGKPARAASQATLERRARREAQAARGGQADPRIKDPKKRERAARQFRRRFTSPGLGTRTPSVALGTIGLESGTLADSVVCAPEANGSFRIYVANVRGVQDKWGTSPLQRVLQAWGDWGGQALMTQQTVQDALQRAARASAAHDEKRLLQDMQRLFRTITATAQQLGATP